MKTPIKNTWLIVLIALSFACEGFLDERPNKKILVPTTLQDLRAMLDNTSDMNVVPAFGLLGSDDLLISDAGWAGLSTTSEQNAYIFAEEVFEGTTSADWARMYRQIFVANVVMDQIGTGQQTNELFGEALFHRAHAHFMLVQLFAAPYNSQTAEVDLAIPLRLNPDVQERAPRVDMATYYNQILTDLEDAFERLPENNSIKSRPSKIAAKALQARVYLTMEEYGKAELAADYVLGSPNYELMEYGELDSLKTYPFATYNAEVIFHSSVLSHSYLSDGNVNVWIHPDIYGSYAVNDLRKNLYGKKRSNGGVSFKGQYTGDYSRFGGLALDEVYFIKAECLARSGENSSALETLDQILVTRYLDGTYVPYSENMPDDVLGEVLNEKRKSLIYRGVNWIDLRRLNKESRYARTITRKVEQEQYILSPGSKKYVYPIPDSELNLNPIPNNDRSS